jgi:hypothetical protein
MCIIKLSPSGKIQSACSFEEGEGAEVEGDGFELAIMAEEKDENFSFASFSKENEKSISCKSGSLV